MDYIDLYYLHAWDIVTPVEEVVSTLTDLVREGKIRYYGLSDTPAWYVARAQTIAEKDGKERIATLQLEYSLFERNIEREHIPAAQELGIGLCPWGPLAGGFLSGKYKREGNGGSGEGRLTMPNPIFNQFTERNWRVHDVADRRREKDRQDLPRRSRSTGSSRSPASRRRFLGATKTAQLDDNSRPLDFKIPADLRKRLDEVSALEVAFTRTTSIEPAFRDASAVAPRCRSGAARYLYDGAVAPPPEKKASAS